MRKFMKWTGIGCGGLVGLLVLVTVVAVVWKPWAPRIEVVDPAAGGQRVTQDGLLGNFYPAPRPGAPAVLVLGGSEGGLAQYTDQTGRMLAEQGFNALVLSYWGGPGQHPRMEHLPLETFDTALAWLGRQPTVDPSRMGVIGASKGGEAALLVASRHPELRAVVGLVPSHVVWQGLDQAELWRMVTGIGGTWTEAGQEVPYLPYHPDYRGGGELVELYRMSLQNAAQHPDAVIPVERSTAPMLLVCGEQDTMWPSCDMSREVQQRARAAGTPEVTLLAYRDAGHLAGGPPLPEGSSFREQLGQWGGSIEGNEHSRADSWPQVVEFLRSNLG